MKRMNGGGVEFEFDPTPAPMTAEDEAAFLADPEGFIAAQIKAKYDEGMDAYMAALLETLPKNPRGFL